MPPIRYHHSFPLANEIIEMINNNSRKIIEYLRMKYFNASAPSIVLYPSFMHAKIIIWEFA